MTKIPGNGCAPRSVSKFNILKSCTSRYLPSAFWIGNDGRLYLLRPGSICPFPINSGMRVVCASHRSPPTQMLFGYNGSTIFTQILASRMVPFLVDNQHKFQQCGGIKSCQNISLAFMEDSHSIGSWVRTAVSLICFRTPESSHGIQSTLKNALNLAIVSEFCTHVRGHESPPQNQTRGSMVVEILHLLKWSPPKHKNRLMFHKTGKDESGAYTSWISTPLWYNRWIWYHTHLWKI